MKVRVVKVGMVKVGMVKVLVVVNPLPVRYPRMARHSCSLGLVILTKYLAQTIVNVLNDTFPSYGFTITERDSASYKADVRGTWDLYVMTDGPLSDRNFTALHTAARCAYTTALRLLTGGSRECAALGAFANAAQVMNGLVASAYALGAVSCIPIRCRAEDPTLTVGIVAPNQDTAQRIARDAAISVSARLAVLGVPVRATYPAGEDGSLVACEIEVHAPWAPQEPGMKPTPVGGGVG